MSKQENKRQKIYHLFNAETKSKQISETNGIICGLYQAQTLTPLITL